MGSKEIWNKVKSWHGGIAGMTLQDLFIFVNNNKPLILIAFLAAPWFSLGLCIAIPGNREEPFVLNFNLGMATM